MRIWKQTTRFVENEQGELIISSTKLEFVPSQDVLATSVNKLQLSKRVKVILWNNDINTIRDLMQKGEYELRRMHRFGRHSFDEVRQAIEKLGLRFGMALENEE